MFKLVPGNGPAPCKVMIIGEAPGAKEEELGVPFVGKAGEVLNGALEEAGLPRKLCYVTNVYKTRPPNNRTPTDEELLSHRAMLFDEFSYVQPKYILLLGNTPLYAFTKKRGVSAVHGTRIAEINSHYAFCTYHPAATLYKKEVRQDFFNDIKTFAKIVSGEYKIHGPHT